MAIESIRISPAARLTLGTNNSNWENPQAREPQTHPAFPASCQSNSNATASASCQIPHNVLARAYTKHIIHLFSSARYPYPSPRSMWQITLSMYISYILSVSGLPTEVGMIAIVLLYRYKHAVPHSVAYGDDAARLFLAAYIVAAKVVSDADLESDHSLQDMTTIAHEPRRGMDFWFHISLQRFPVEEICRMERELCDILHWDVQVSRQTFLCFRRTVYRECHVDVDELEDIQEEDIVEERLQAERAERPPPPYSEAQRDVRLVDQELPAQIQPPQAYALIPSAHGMYEGDVEDRQRFARMFEDVRSPQKIMRTAQEAPGNMAGKEKCLFVVFKERISQILSKRSVLTCGI